MLKESGRFCNSVDPATLDGRGHYARMRQSHRLPFWDFYGSQDRRARAAPDAFEKQPQGALDSLKSLIAECRIETPKDLPPMAAGLFGYLAFGSLLSSFTFFNMTFWDCPAILAILNK